MLRSVKQALLYYILLVIVIGMHPYALGMEKSIGTNTIRVQVDDTLYTLPLQKLLAHLCGYQKVVNPKTGKSIISGFHWYPQPPAERIIKFHEGPTLCKLSSDLWVVALEDVSRFHRGYILYKGEVIEKPKTFFPSTWNKEQVLTFIARILQEGAISLEEEKDYNAYKEYTLKITHPQESLPFRMVVSGCPAIAKSMHIVTLFPALKTKLSSYANVRALAVQQIKEKEALQATAQMHIRQRPELLNALYEEQLTAALDLLSLGADPNIISENNIVPLMVAAKRGNWEAVNLLVEYGAVKEVVDSQGNTPLHWAVRSGDYYTVLGLITKEVVDKPNNAKETPLILALAGRHIDIVKLLLECGAAIHVKDTHGRGLLTQVVSAIAQTKEDVIADAALAELLLAYGADREEQNVSGTTPLIQAVLLNKKPLVELLLRHNADYEVTYKKENLVILAKKYGYLNIAHCIEEYIGKKKEWLEEQQATELMYAVYTNNIRKVQALIAQVNVNEQNVYQQSALFFAIENNHFPLVQILLQAGANPCLKTPAGVSIYEYAQSRKGCNQELVKLLILEAGRRLEPLKQEEARKHQERKMRDELVSKALENNDLSTVPDNIIHEYKNKPLTKHKDTLLLCAVRKRKYNVVSQLLAYKADTQAQNNQSEDVLTIACNAHDKDMLALLIKSGKCKSIALERCLMELLKQGKDVLVETIVQEVPSIIFDLAYKLLGKQETALCLKLLTMQAGKLSASQAGTLCIEAIYQREQLIVQALCTQYPSVITYVNEKDETLLIAAAKANNTEAVEFLCNQGASIEQKDKRGYKALDYAQGNVLQLLMGKHNEQLAAQKNRQKEREKEEQEKQLKEKGYSSLMIAIYQGDRQKVKESKESLSHTDKEGQTTLMLAAQLGDYEIIQELLSKEESASTINSVDNKGYTALLYALEKRHFLLVQPLLNKGATIVGVTNKNALAVAAASRAPKNIKKMLKDRIELEIIAIFDEHSNQTRVPEPYKEAFHAFSIKRKKRCIAISLNAFSSNAVASILYSWINDNAIAARISKELLEESIKEKQHKVINFVLEVSPNLVTYDNIFQSVINNDPATVDLLLFQGQYTLSIPQAAHLCMESLKRGYTDSVMWLINCYRQQILKFTVVNVEEYSITLFGYLCQVGPRDVIEFILNSKMIDVNYIDPSSGNTPLMCACKAGRKDIVELLLRYQADIALKNKSGATALFFALAGGNKELVKLVYQKGALLRNCVSVDKNPFRYSELAPHLYDILKDIDWDPEDATLLLQWLCSSDSLVREKAFSPKECEGIFYWLVRDKCARINELNLEYECTLLHLAIVHKSSKDLLKFFYDWGVPIDAQNKSGKTALMLACAFNDVERVQILLELGANPNLPFHNKGNALNNVLNRELVCVSNGDTPFLTACEEGNLAVVRLLVESGKVDLSIKNNQGEDAYEKIRKGAMSFPHKQEMYKYIEKYLKTCQGVAIRLIKQTVDSLVE